MRFGLLAVAGLAGLIAQPVLAQEKVTEETVAKPALTLEERKNIDARLLDNLLARLNAATSERQAKAIEATVLQLWLRNYSASVEVLMKQAISAINDEAHASALTLLDTVIEISPDYAEAWNKRATVHFFSQDYERSLADIDRVLELEPRHFGALAGRALVHRAMGDKKKALQSFREALEIHPYLDGAKSAVKALKKEVEGERI
ncbi:MAG: tetratricopeptide repeat protein [Pseudomonadota bacterium]